MFFLNDLVVYVRSLWRRLIQKPLDLTFRSFPDPNRPKPPSAEALARLRMAERVLREMRGPR